MSQNNGVIRIGRKGLKKFAFGEDGIPFEVDVVVSFQQWIDITDELRPEMPDEEGNRPIQDMPTYHARAVQFVEGLGGQDYVGKVTVAEALDFVARLREQYDELATFFRPKSREERDLPATSEAGLRFSVETK
jgi:hypothetical protein